MTVPTCALVQKDGKDVHVTVGDLEKALELHKGIVLGHQKKINSLQDDVNKMLGNDKHKGSPKEQGGTKKRTGGSGDKPGPRQQQAVSNKMRKTCARIGALTRNVQEEMRSIFDLYDVIVSAYQSEVADLKARDSYNDSSSAPPSKETLTRKEQKKLRSGTTQKKSDRNPGAQPGHEGPRKGKKAEIDEEKKCEIKACTCCGSENIQVIKSATETRTETPPRPKAVTTRYLILTYACDDCTGDACTCPKKEECTGGAMTAKAGIPRDGMYGQNVIVNVAANHISRQPNRMNSDTMSRENVSLSSGTVSHTLDRLGGYLIGTTEEIKRLIRRCRIVHADETSISYNGVTYWLWVFLDPLSGRVCYTISEKRNSDAPVDVLGPDWDGVLVCDGWTSYGRYVKQRCWAHLIRELEVLSLKKKTSAEAAAALEALRRIFHDAKQILACAYGARVQHRKKLAARVRRLIKKYADDPITGEFMAKLGRALPDLFRFVLDPRIPPTNNAAEQALREPIIVRRIRGCIRSEKSLTRTARIFTCTATWKNLGLDPLEEIRKAIPMI